MKDLIACISWFFFETRLCTNEELFRWQTKILWILLLMTIVTITICKFNDMVLFYEELLKEYT